MRPVSLIASMLAKKENSITKRMYEMDWLENVWFINITYKLEEKNSKCPICLLGIHLNPM